MMHMRFKHSIGVGSWMIMTLPRKPRTHLYQATHTPGKLLKWAINYMASKPWVPLAAPPGPADNRPYIDASIGALVHLLYFPRPSDETQTPRFCEVFVVVPPEWAVPIPNLWVRRRSSMHSNLLAVPLCLIVYFAQVSQSVFNALCTWEVRKIVHSWCTGCFCFLLFE